MPDIRHHGVLTILLLMVVVMGTGTALNLEGTSLDKHAKAPRQQAGHSTRGMWQLTDFSTFIDYPDARTAALRCSRCKGFPGHKSQLSRLSGCILNRLQPIEFVGIALPPPAGNQNKCRESKTNRTVESQNACIPKRSSRKVAITLLGLFLFLWSVLWLLQPTSVSSVRGSERGTPHCPMLGNVFKLSIRHE